MTRLNDDKPSPNGGRRANARTAGEYRLRNGPPMSDHMSLEGSWVDELESRIAALEAERDTAQDMGDECEQRTAELEARLASAENDGGEGYLDALYDYHRKVETLNAHIAELERRNAMLTAVVLIADKCVEPEPDDYDSEDAYMDACDLHRDSLAAWGPQRKELRDAGFPGWEDV